MEIGDDADRSRCPENSGRLQSIKEHPQANLSARRLLEVYVKAKDDLGLGFSWEACVDQLVMALAFPVDGRASTLFRGLGRIDWFGCDLRPI